MFLAAVRKLPAALQHALHEAELDDAGLLQVYPRTHWRALGLPPRGTWHEGRARSSPPMAQATTVSLTVSLSVPPTLPLPSFSSPSVSPSLLFSSPVVGSLCSVQSCEETVDECTASVAGTGSLERRHLDDRGEVVGGGTHERAGGDGQGHAAGGRVAGSSNPVAETSAVCAAKGDMDSEARNVEGSILGAVVTMVRGRHEVNSSCGRNVTGGVGPEFPDGWTEVVRSICGTGIPHIIDHLHITHITCTHHYNTAIHRHTHHNSACTSHYAHSTSRNATITRAERPTPLYFHSHIHNST